MHLLFSEKRIYSNNAIKNQLHRRDQIPGDESFCLTTPCSWVASRRAELWDEGCMCVFEGDVLGNFPQAWVLPKET